MKARKMSSSLLVSPTSSSLLRQTLFVYTTLLSCAVLSLICYHSQNVSIWKTNFFSRDSDSVELTDSLKEPNFRNALLYSVIIAIPMVADSLLDFALLSNRYQERLHWYSRALVLFALVAPNLLLLTVDFGESTNMAYLCGYRFFRVACVLSAGSVTATVAFKNKNIASDGFLAVLQLGIIGFMVKGVGMFCNPPLYDSLDQLSIFTRFLSLLTLLHSGLLKYVYRDSIFLTRMLEPTELTVLTYAVSLSAMHIAFEIVIIYMKRFSCDCITSFVFIQMAFVVTITVLQSRINRMEHVRQSKFNEERQAFIRYISHEIRTPLNTVFLGLEFLAIELLKLHPGSDNILVSSLIDIVSDIQSPCQISLAILDDLLTFDKVEGGKMALDLKHIGCCDFISAVVKPFCLNAKEKGIDFSTNFNLVSKQFIINACIHVDPSKMGQVIRNLLSNAIKFTPVQGKVAITLKHEITAPDRRVESTDCIERSSSPDEFAAGDHWLRIEVADSGAGISTLDQNKLFGQYVQFNVNKLQEGKGSGLGLWISKGIAELHGGIIGVYSEGEGKGSTFYLDLPVHFHESDYEFENEDGDVEETKYEIEEKTNRTSMTVDDRAHASPPNATISSEGSADITLVKFAATPCTGENSSRHAAPSPTSTIQTSSILSASATATATATGIVPPSSGFYTCMSHIRCPTDTRDSSAGFLSSADHFMVTSTPASRSSERVIRSTGIVSLESYEDYFLETSGRASPACILDTSGTARDPSNKLYRRHHGQSVHSAHNSSARTSPILSDSSSSFSPGGVRVRRGSEDNSHYRDRKYSFSTLVADRLNSALEAIAALSFQDSAPDTSNPICGHERSMSSSTSPVTLIAVKANYPALRLNHGVEVEEEKDIREEGQSEDYPKVPLGGPSYRDNQRSLNQIGNGNGSNHHDVDVVCPPSEIQIRNPRPSPMARTVRCLVVDDSSTSRRMLRRLLTAQNYFVLEATDGSNCINVWEREKALGEAVDVIFMDSIMPLMTGPEAAKILRGKGFTGLIVGLSGLTHADDIEDFKKSGADVVLTKPLKFAIMDVLVKDFIETRLQS